MHHRHQRRPRPGLQHRRHLPLEGRPQHARRPDHPLHLRPVPVNVRLTQGTDTPEITRILGSHGILEVSANSVILTPQTGLDSSPDYGLNGFPSALHAAYEKQWHAEHDPELAEHPLEDVTVWHGASWDDLRPHLANFFNSVRTRKPPVEDVVFGHHAASACHMANTSFFEGKVIRRA